MSARLDALRREVAILRELRRRQVADPLAAWDLLPGQHAFASSSARFKLYRGGWQYPGKTHVGAMCTLWRATGTHPLHVVRRPPVRIWVICAAGEQAQIVAKRLWDLAPKDALDPRTQYDERKGTFLGVYPKMMFRNGSVIEIKSGKSDRMNIASGSPDAIWVDEPPESESVFAQLLGRVRISAGDVYLTFTPEQRPVDYLQERCEREPGSPGWIEDHHYRMEPQNMVFVRSGRRRVLQDGRALDQSWIDEQLAMFPGHEVPVVCHGEWEYRSAGAYFEGAWDPLRMVHTNAPVGTSDVVLGIDHGSRPGKQIAVLMLVQATPDGHPFVYVLDEYVDTVGTATPEDDARAVLDMLGRHGIRWQDLDDAAGDRVHMKGWGQQKSNRDLQVHIARRRKVHVDSLRPRIRTVKRGEGRGRGSVAVGSRWLYHQMVRDRFAVHPRCERVVEALPKYSMADDDWKDPIDAIRYGLDAYIFGAQRGRPPKLRLA